MQRFTQDAYFINLYSALTGLAMSVLGYFLPIKDILHLMVLGLIYSWYLLGALAVKENWQAEILDQK